MKNNTHDSKEKIKNAAKMLFFTKGYAATSIRDIAELINGNQSMVMYHFVSKANLYEIIVKEALDVIFAKGYAILSDQDSNLDEKLVRVTDMYFDLFRNDPELIRFIVTEVQNNPTGLLHKLSIGNFINEISFCKQYKMAYHKGQTAEPDPIQFLLNIIGLIIAPFILKPFIDIYNINEYNFEALTKHRQKLIPTWLSTMMKPQ